MCIIVFFYLHSRKMMIFLNEILFLYFFLIFSDLQIKKSSNNCKIVNPAKKRKKTSKLSNVPVSKISIKNLLPYLEKDVHGKLNSNY